ncbi:Uncharacterised protein [Shigella sonnei]|jgi:hypothetical protein|nr:Uncharacterised protein [Shigella sonnei]CSH34026.1 Uncharacterised protein [Shigella sonnei]CSP30534.1 Uncharacterised protein [Shigella sonnei]CSP46796.1 Uncharacterised protein [Shigella sonnei]CSQ67148.1 Uncharacterised protein [Shigella sonnei]
MFFVEDVLKLMANLLDIQRLEMKLQTARQNRHRQFLWIGRRQQKLNVLRRLFKGF